MPRSDVRRGALRSRATPLVLTLLLAVLAGCSMAVGQAGGPVPAPAEPQQRQVIAAGPPRAAQTAAAPRPDIVLVLMDDFSMDLLQTMKGARHLARKGASYDHFVVDSLCCVSRASLMTGQYPHQTGVRTNTASVLPGAGPMGGWSAFSAYGNTARSVNVRLQKAGYSTGFVGKYLNEYEYVPGVKPVPPVPAGWSQFHAVFGSAYDGWGFYSTELVAGRLQLRTHATPSAYASMAERDAAYAGQVVEDYALDFIREHRGDAAPYFLEVAPYAPHNRTNPEGAYPGDPLFPAAFRDRPGGSTPAGNCGPVPCGQLGVDDLPGFGDKRADNTPRTGSGAKARPWNTGPRLSAAAATNHLRSRAQMVQSIDRTLRKILKAVDENTVVVLTSDNGFHLGQVGLGLGKGTPYDTDVRVPLLVKGPGIVPGERQELTSNLDLAPTFEELAGLLPAAYRSGTSLVPTFTDPTLRTRGFVFFEHTSDAVADDPDKAFTGGELKRIPSYVAVRSRTGLLIRHDLASEPGTVETAWEYYSYKRQRWEQRNVVHKARHAAEVKLLRAKLAAFDDCARIQRDAPVSQRCRRLTQR